MTTAVCLMGPTATGKTDLAIALRQRFPVEIISVDSALVYRGMDIGTAKPDAATLAETPHRLVDIRDPEEPYSAGAFVRDAVEAMDEIRAEGRVPLLVGGTMLYFRALTEGLAELPSASPELRASIEREAARDGWPAMHKKLRAVDPAAALRIEPNDRQRIQRALEVYLASGETLTSLQSGTERPDAGYDYVNVALNPGDRSVLHARIETRLNEMVQSGFVDEVRTLMQRPGLKRDMPSMRAVGYRQYWSFLEGEIDAEEALRRALFATRQLAKRQITWLRKTSGVFHVDPLEGSAIDAISAYLAPKLA